MMLFAPATAFAQADIADVSQVSFFGVDFSKVQIMGADESDAQFAAAFDGINYLILAEPAKYDLGRAFRKTVVVEDLSTVSRRNAGLNIDLRGTDPNRTLSDRDMARIVDAYRSAGDTGYGLVIAGELLNKATGYGTYLVMFFDRSNGDIIYSQRVSGRAGGFGLRNYWARSLYDVLNKWRY